MEASIHPAVPGGFPTAEVRRQVNLKTCSALFALLLSLNLAIVGIRVHSLIERGRLTATTGTEGPMVYSVWKARHNYPIYEAPALVFSNSLYNFMYYQTAASVAKVLHLDGDDLLLSTRLTTATFAVLGFVVGLITVSGFGLFSDISGVVLGACALGIFWFGTVLVGLVRAPGCRSGLPCIGGPFVFSAIPPQRVNLEIASLVALLFPGVVVQAEHRFDVYRGSAGHVSLPPAMEVFAGVSWPHRGGGRRGVVPGWRQLSLQHTHGSVRRFPRSDKCGQGSSQALGRESNFVHRSGPGAGGLGIRQEIRREFSGGIEISGGRPGMHILVYGRGRSAVMPEIRQRRQLFF